MLRYFIWTFSIISGTSYWRLWKGFLSVTPCAPSGLGQTSNPSIPLPHSILDLCTPSKLKLIFFLPAKSLSEAKMSQHKRVLALIAPNRASSGASRTLQKEAGIEANTSTPVLLEQSQLEPETKKKQSGKYLISICHLMATALIFLRTRSSLAETFLVSWFAIKEIGYKLVRLPAGYQGLEVGSAFVDVVAVMSELLGRGAETCTRGLRV